MQKAQVAEWIQCMPHNCNVHASLPRCSYWLINYTVDVYVVVTAC